MKRIILYLFVLISFLFSSYCLMNEVNMYVYNKGSVEFVTTGPFGTIKAESKKITGSLDTEKKTFSFSIPIASFEGFNNPLQKKHFNEKYMESDKIPTATFKGKIIEDIDYSVPGTYQIRAKGDMNIHGVSNEMIVKSKLMVKNELIQVESAFTVMLQDFNIKIPSKVDDKIAVNVNFDLISK